MLERSLPFAIVVKAELVNRCVVKRPGMGNIPLLKTFVNNGTEARNARSGGLKYRKRRDQVVIVKIVVNAEVLITIDAVIKPDRKLVAALRLHWGGNESATAGKWSGNIVQQVDSSRIQAR